MAVTVNTKGFIQELAGLSDREREIRLRLFFRRLLNQEGARSGSSSGTAKGRLGSRGERLEVDIEEPRGVDRQGDLVRSFFEAGAR